MTLDEMGLLVAIEVALSDLGIRKGQTFSAKIRPIILKNFCFAKSGVID